MQMAQRSLASPNSCAVRLSPATPEEIHGQHRAEGDNETLEHAPVDAHCAVGANIATSDRDRPDRQRLRPMYSRHVPAISSPLRLTALSRPRQAIAATGVSRS